MKALALTVQLNNETLFLGCQRKHILNGGQKHLANLNYSIAFSGRIIPDAEIFFPCCVTVFIVIVRDL